MNRALANKTLSSNHKFNTDVIAQNLEDHQASDKSTAQFMDDLFAEGNEDLMQKPVAEKNPQKKTEVGILRFFTH